MSNKQAESAWTLGAPSAARFRVIWILVAGVLLFLAAFGTLLVLAWLQAGSPGLGDYLSQLGATDEPGAGRYRLAVLCVAAAAALAAGAWRLRAPHVGAAGFLAMSAAAFVVSSIVPCAAGCPIPVREGLTTLPNFVHFSISGAAFALAVAAMASVGAADVEPRLRRSSRLASRIAIALYAVLAGLMVIFGHALVNGLVERCLAVLSLAWLALAAVQLTRRGS